MSASPSGELPPGSSASVRASAHRTSLALVGLLLCLLAPLAWWATIDYPWMRASGAAAWLTLLIGLLLGASAALVDRRLWVRAVMVLGLAMLGLFVWLFFGFARLPATTGTLERASDFTLPDHLGRSVTLSQELARGPVLLVFYRGHW